MKTSRPKFETIDAYIATFPEDVRKKLEIPYDLVKKIVKFRVRENLDQA